MSKKVHEGVVEAVLLMPPGDGAASIDKSEVEVDWDGFVGDKHYGPTKSAGSSQKPYPKGAEVRNTRQVSIVSAEELADIAEAMDLPSVKADWVGANMSISGIPNLSKLSPGTRLHFADGAGLVIEGENMPCTTAGATLQEQYPDKEGLVKNFPKKALGKRGVVAWVERPGLIRRGDKVTAQLTEISIHND